MYAPWSEGSVRVVGTELDGRRLRGGKTYSGKRAYYGFVD